MDRGGAVRATAHSADFRFWQRDVYERLGRPRWAVTDDRRPRRAGDFAGGQRRSLACGANTPRPGRRVIHRRPKLTRTITTKRPPPNPPTRACLNLKNL